MLTRRQFLVHTAMATAGAQLARAFSTVSGQAPPVKVAQGLLQGEQHDGFQVFRGVPFAQPPVGPLRFRPPQPLPQWTGVHDATHFAAASVQSGNPSLRQSEDCLYLNIWAPQGAGPFPVFVWIHGGGFTGGYSFDPISDGEHFARNGIVCITVAYRLGVLGFLDVSPLLGPSYAGSANNGLQDLIAALTWVQTNVHAFGGDPQQVTIGGESAGAKLSDMLMGIPSAAPLFHQVISESGGAERISAADRSDKVARDFGAAWTGQTQLPLDRLLAAPAEQLIEVQQQFLKSYPLHFPLRAELDRKLIPHAPIEAIRHGSSRGKRLLLGTNRDESAFFLGPHPQKVTSSDLGNLTLPQFQAVADQYNQLYPDMSEDLRRIRSVTAEEYWVPSIRVAEAHLDGGGEAFVYRLDFPGEGKFAGLAFHSYDLRFVWERFGTAPESAPARNLATEMHDAWASFIHGQTPNAEGLPAWPAYTLPQRPTMIFNSTSQIESAPDARELALWKGLLMG